jgi:hypothetical protein
MPRLPNKNSKSGSNEPGALVFEQGKEPKKFVIIASLVIFLVVIGGVYIGLRWHKNSLEAKKVELDEKIKELTRESRKPIIDEALSFRNRSNEAEKLLREHKYWNEVFSLLEEITIPEVQYSEFRADLNSKEIRLDITTPSFRRISQQILVYKKIDQIEELQFNPPKKTESGVNMSATLVLSPQVWQKDN